MPIEITVKKPTGEENFKVLGAFKDEANSYVVLDSKRKDSNQNTVTYVCRIDGDTLIDEQEEQPWRATVKALSSVIKGETDSSALIDLDNKVYNASESIGHSLALKDEHVNKLVQIYQTRPVAEVQAAPQEVVSEVQSVPQEVVAEAPAEEVISMEQTLTAEPAPEAQNVISAMEEIVPAAEQPVVAETPVYAEQSVMESVVAPQEIIPSAPESIFPQPEAPAAVESTIVEQVPVVEEPVIAEAPAVMESTSVADDSIGQMKADIIQLIDRLEAKEKELAQREANLKVQEETAQAQLTIAQTAFNNAQAVQDQMTTSGESDPTLVRVA